MHLVNTLPPLKEAQPLAIREQKLLFDHVREGEKVLHLLETISPTAFMEQYGDPLSLLSVLSSVAGPLPDHTCGGQDVRGDAHDDLQRAGVPAGGQAAHRASRAGRTARLPREGRARGDQVRVCCVCCVCVRCVCGVVCVCVCVCVWPDSSLVSSGRRSERPCTVGSTRWRTCWLAPCLSSPRHTFPPKASR